MEFQALYYQDRLKIVNPEGDVAITTLWSKVESAYQILEEAGVDLSPESSRIGPIANLYGNGLPQMLRNLLWNPQIRRIVILGKNLSGSREWLLNFFEHGLEEVEFLGAKAFRIRNTPRTIDGCVQPSHFLHIPGFTVLGDVGDAATKAGLKSFFDALPPAEPSELTRVEPPPIPEPTVTRFPTEPRSHTIVRDTPMEAWSELIFRLFRFGHRNMVAKKSGPEGRVELQNIKAIIESPREEPDEILQQFGFSLEKFQGYQRRILDPEKPPDLGYTYGNRLRGYFRRGDGTLIDSLEIAAQRLKEKPESRHAYIALWDNTRDLPEGTDTPCFVSAFFRKFDGKLTLTATFRSHNAMEAWPENVYGLIAIQRFVAEKTGMEPGPLTVFSHSISIDVSSLEKARKIATSKESDEVHDPSTGKLGPRMDPNGEFTTTFDRATWEIVVEHSYDGMKLGEYRGKSAEEIERQLARDVAISELSHALYLGREVARKEFEMKAARAKGIFVIVFFDIGSTLIDGPPFGPARRLSETLDLGPRAIPELERILFRSPASDPEQLAHTIVNRLRVEHNRALDACTSLWNAQLQEAYVLPGAREAIEKLKSAGISRAYLSNIWPPFYAHFQQEFPEEAECQPQFLSFETGLMKPDPAFFQLALRAVEARAEDAVMVGDTYKNDIRPAIELGMRTVWVLHRPEKEKADLIDVLNGNAPPPDLTIASIGELCKLSLYANH